MQIVSRRVRILALQVAVVLACAGVGFVIRSALTSEDGGVGALPAPTAAAPGRFTLGAAQSRSVAQGAALIASAKHGSIVLYRHPAGPRIGRLRQRIFNRQRIPLTFLVDAQRKGWARVRLPTRPNLALAWVRRRDVRYTTTSYRIVVRRRAHRLTLILANRVMWTKKVALGRSVSPTPYGRYFVTDLIRPPRPDGFYGPYALGISAHSRVLTSFEGGNGQIGIHGTNDPSSIGTNVSHGCIRVTNDVVTKLAHSVPLGTPVDIRA